MTSMNVWMPLMVGLKPDAAGAWAVSMGYGEKWTGLNSIVIVETVRRTATNPCESIRV